MAAGRSQFAKNCAFLAQFCDDNYSALRRQTDELDERHRRRIALAHAGLQRARISALSRGEMGSDLPEQTLHRVARLHRLARHATRVDELRTLGGGRLVALCDERVD